MADLPPGADDRVAGNGAAAAEEGVSTVTVTGHPADQPAPLHVDIPGFSGTLEQLVHLAQRGEIDLQEVSVSRITGEFRRRLSEEQPPDPREVADFLSLSARLLTLKAHRLLPEGRLEGDGEPEDVESDVDDPGARLAEYRLFKAAAEALLAPVAEEGVRSFLGVVSPEVVYGERLAIPPERLAAAFRAVLERLPEAEPFMVETITFSVEEKAAQLRQLLAARTTVAFEELFAQARSRLEAVAIFLALLEVVRSGDASVGQVDAFGPITVSQVG